MICLQTSLQMKPRPNPLGTGNKNGRWLLNKLNSGVTLNPAGADRKVCENNRRWSPDKETWRIQTRHNRCWHRWNNKHRFMAAALKWAPITHNRHGSFHSTNSTLAYTLINNHFTTFWPWEKYWPTINMKYKHLLWAQFVTLWSDKNLNFHEIDNNRDKHNRMSVAVKNNTMAVQHAPRLSVGGLMLPFRYFLMGNFSITQAEKGKRRDFLDECHDPQAATTLRRMLALRGQAQLLVAGVNGATIIPGCEGKEWVLFKHVYHHQVPHKEALSHSSSGLGWKESILGSQLLKVWELRYFTSLSRWLVEVRENYIHPGRLFLPLGRHISGIQHHNQSEMSFLWV